MKIIFYYVGTPTPIFETELELVRKHENAGDTVRFLQCTGNLDNCFWNPDKHKFVCSACRSKFMHGWGVLNSGENVELKNIPLQIISPDAIPESFNTVDDLKQFRYDNEKIGWGIASRLVSLYRDHRFDTKRYKNEVFRELNTSVQVYETLKQEFEVFNPDLVYVFNGRITTQLPAILLCKKMGIDYCSYEMGYNLNTYILRNNSTTHSIEAFNKEAEMLWAHGGEDRETIARSYYEKKRNGVDGQKFSSFTKYQQKKLLPSDFNRDKRNIVIFNSTMDEYSAIEDWQHPIYKPDENAGIGRIVNDLKFDDRYVFYLRVHPNMKNMPSTTSQLQDIKLLDSRHSNLHVIWPEDEVDSYELMEACEKVITFGSTMGIEAAYWGRPSIMVGRALYEDLDCIYVPKTHEDVIELLKKDLPPLPVNSALKYGFRDLSAGIPYEYFRETGMKGTLPIGTFDGVALKAAFTSLLRLKICQFLWRAGRVIVSPSLILKKVKQR